MEKLEEKALRARSESNEERSRSRSREKKAPEKRETYMRKANFYDKNNDNNEIAEKPNLFISYNEDDPEEKEKTNIKREVLRSFLRIEQCREEPIDKFVKIVWILKGRLPYDHSIHDIMSDPKRYIDKLSIAELAKMIPLAEGHKSYEKFEHSAYEKFWVSLIGLLEHFHKKLGEIENTLEPEYEERIKEIISKPLPELLKLEKQTKMILKTQNFGSNQEYWVKVLSMIKLRRNEIVLQDFYTEFKQNNAEKIYGVTNEVEEETFKEPISPNLVPFSSINPKLIVEDGAENEAKQKLSEKIFKLEFEKGKEKLEINLSIPHNHSLLSTDIIAEQTNTYDQITKEIIEFERYKRMEEDEEDFNDWVPCETEGNFRSEKPVCINRVRVACEWNKYNNLHYTEDNPPPKTVQGYKFNIFYPDLYDKQKTPQYYLEPTDDPNYCVIKFKAGPPYKDIAFRVLRKEWDFTEKSGFESIFSRGILHLYFNFKKPRFRI